MGIYYLTYARITSQGWYWQVKAPGLKTIRGCLQYADEQDVQEILQRSIRTVNCIRRGRRK